jgi:hypothetical protein
MRKLQTESEETRFQNSLSDIAAVTEIPLEEDRGT